MNSATEFLRKDHQVSNTLEEDSSSIRRCYLSPHLGMHDFRKYSAPYKTSYGLRVGRTADLRVREFPLSLHGWWQHWVLWVAQMWACGKLLLWPGDVNLLKTHPPLGFPNLFWFNYFKYAGGHSSNFELVKSEIKSEINFQQCSYRLFLSYLHKYLFSLST